MTGDCRSSRYDSFVPELEDGRFKARKWCMHYNNHLPEEATTLRGLVEARQKLLTQILGYAADNKTCIEPPFTVDYGCNISVGKRFYANFNLTVVDCGIVTFGDRVMLGPNVSILAATHETDVRSRWDDIEYALPITVGDDCWIGGNVVILPGVTIGKGCTIAAGAVVSRDIPDWSVAMGVPARVVKKLEEYDYEEVMKARQQN